MGRHLWIFHPATVEFDFKDFIETVIPIWVNALPWRRHLEDTIAKYFFGGAKLALKKALTTVTDMKQPELAWFVRILQKSLQMIWIRAVK